MDCVTIIRRYHRSDKLSSINVEEVNWLILANEIPDLLTWLSYAGMKVWSYQTSPHYLAAPRLHLARAGSSKLQLQCRRKSHPVLAARQELSSLFSKAHEIHLSAFAKIVQYELVRCRSIPSSCQFLSEHRVSSA